MEIEPTIDDLVAARLVNEFAVAGITLALVDFLDTLPEEVRLIWPTTMNLCKALFLAVRYGNMILAVLLYICELSQTLVREDCERMFTAISILEVTLSVTGEAIVYIRVWAFSGCDRRVLYYLIAQYITMSAGGFYFLMRFIVSAKVYSAAPLPVFSCIMDSGNSILAVVYGILLASVIILMLLMVVIGVYRYNTTPHSIRRNGLFVQFYRDGLVYFLMLGALCIANIASIVIGHRLFLVELQIYLHSIVSTRMFFHLREYAGQTEHALYADSNQEQVESSPFGMLKAVLPRFTTARNPAAISTTRRTATIKFASLRVPTGDSSLL